MPVSSQADILAPDTQIQEEQGQGDQEHSLEPSGIGSPSVLVRPLTPSGGSPPGVRPSLPDTDNRCLQPRLGRGLRRKKVCRNLSTQGVLASRRSAGNHDSFQGSSVLPSASPSRSSSCSDGQNNRHLVSEQVGRDEIPLA